MDKIKELFVVQYWGQKVYKPETVSDPMEVNSGNMGSGYLLLRSVGQLTDEEKITIASIVCTRHNRHYNPEEISYQISEKREFDIILLVKGVRRYMVQIDSDGIGFVEYWMGGGGRVSYFAPGQHTATDYLRSIGILLPITYLEENKPVTIQPEEIIKRGWAKYQGICKH